MQSAGTYSHHYAYSAHVKAAAYMSRNSGVLFVATRHFPSVRWYDIDSHLDYSCPAALLPGVDWLATLTATLWENTEDIEEEFSVFKPMFSANR